MYGCTGVRRWGGALVGDAAPDRPEPNLTQSVRKAFIVQHAPDGARWEDGPCDNPDWQFPALIGGSGVI